tara:strand:+ start:426 stop:1166 length:741 start_codon:yes stop_codon:yes gene_type:complete
MQFIFIIAAGRSGSTVLQSLLNSNSNVLIRGENNNFFYETFTTYQSLQKQNKSDERDHPWFGFEHFAPDRYAKMVRKLGRKYLLGDHSRQTTKKLGFKEIRLFNLFNSQGIYSRKGFLIQKGVEPRTELIAYIKYLKHLFPNSKTIFLRRNPHEIAESGWWKDRSIYDFELLCKDLKSFQDEFEKIALPGHDLCIDYQLLHSQDMRSIRKSVHEPLGLKFNRLQSKKVLTQKLNHGQWKNIVNKNL